jgi:hypothetical protein
MHVRVRMTCPIGTPARHGDLNRWTRRRPRG